MDYRVWGAVQTSVAARSRESAQQRLQQAEWGLLDDALAIIKNNPSFCNRNNTLLRSQRECDAAAHLHTAKIKLLIDTLGGLYPTNLRLRGIVKGSNHLQYGGIRREAPLGWRGQL